MRGRPEIAPRAAVLAVALAALAAAPLRGQDASPAPRDQRWREDLAFLARELPAAHKDAFAHTTRVGFDSLVHALDLRIPQLTDARIVLELARIVASLRDSHTSLRVSPAAIGAHALPVSLIWFDDGIFVMAADSAHSDIAGARVLDINGVPAEVAATRAAAYLAWDNEATLRANAPGLLIVQEVLEGAGVVPADTTPELRLATAAGERFVPLAAVPLHTPLKLVGPLSSVQPPLYQSNPRTAYWYQLLDDSTVYFQYNRCADDPARPLGQFTTELLAQLDQPAVRRLIVDLRLNGGGNSSLLRPFENGVKAWLERTPDATLYALTSRRTFSSALINAFELEQLGAVLAGQPTGGRPNHFGELKVLELPNSKLTVAYSTKYFVLIPGEDPESLVPDVPVPLLSEDVFGGRDPVLARVLAPER